MGLLVQSQVCYRYTIPQDDVNVDLTETYESHGLHILQGFGLKTTPKPTVYSTKRAEACQAVPGEIRVIHGRGTGGAWFASLPVWSLVNRANHGQGMPRLGSPVSRI